MTHRITRAERRAAEIVETDRRVAVATAEETVISAALELAPLSYAALAELPAGGLGAALVDLPDELVRPQALRLLVERGKATGRFWGWGDVDTLEGWLRAEIARARAEQLAARIGRAQAAKIAEMLREEPAPCATCGSDGGPCVDCSPAPARAPSPIVPTAGQIEAALLAIETDAVRRARYARDGGDADGEKLANREAQACRDATALALEGAYRVAGNGDLLVKSPRGMWHRVGRQPADGESYSPILCSCEWGQKSNGLGPCKHQALWEGYYAAADQAVAELDDAAAFDVAA